VTTLDLDSLLRLADEDWEFGQLVSARTRYAAALRMAPGNWHAAFQLAWIEAGFGHRDPATLRRVDIAGLPERAGNALRVLTGGHLAPLDGSIEDWDIEHLRSSGKHDANWWEQRGQAAQKAGQYGLAIRCYSEATELEPDHYFDPPPHVQRAPHEFSVHMDAVRAGAAAK
jgi:tetratricopeptide (TPR) repeat protein